ncbi:MAG: HU family DNA-binding protein, partial [Microcoleaceae cyanobacterium]
MINPIAKEKRNNYPLGKISPSRRSKVINCSNSYRLKYKHNLFPNLGVSKMNKGELVDAIAQAADVTKKDADKVLSAALEVIMDAVSSGDKVTLVGFGSFESRERKAREGRNPKTGEKMEIPETVVPAFSAGKS